MLDLTRKAVDQTQSPEYIGVFDSIDGAINLNIQLQARPIAPGEERAGADVSDILRLLLPIYKSFQEKAPCSETAGILMSLQDAIDYSDLRDADRAKRGVEGTQES